LVAEPADHAEELTVANPPCTGIHTWGRWKVIGYTGDWFHPHIIERKCAVCPASEQDES
jgi:hypothetical protein